jgi:signal transduction histidine kinase
VVILDYQLGAQTGLDFLAELHRCECAIPVIMLTGRGDREVDVLSMRSGAADYLCKRDLRTDILERAVRYAVERSRSHAKLAELQHRLAEEREKLMQADRLSSIGLLAASVAHEINNPLCGVMALVKALRTPVPLSDDKAREYLETIQDGLERMRGTVQGLLDFARERPLLIEPLDLSTLVEHGLKLCASALRKHKLSVTLRIEPGQARVMADNGRLTQVLLNLVLNAADATPAGGSITIMAEQVGARVGLTVRDTGSGIPEDIRDRVCDPFFTTKPAGQGTGLGLAISQRIIKAHKGELVISSPKEGGAAITIWLPAAK